MSDHKRLTKTMDELMNPLDTLIKCRDRLAELEDKIENGTLIEIPCKFGDTIYLILDAKHPEHRRILECKVYGFIIQKTSIHIQFKATPENRYDHYGYFDIDDIGKIAFFTQVEAEAKLEELKRGQK